MNATRKVPFFDYPRVFLDEQDALINTLKDVGHRGAFIMQGDLKEFESALAAFTGSPFAMGVGNATDALEFGWLSIGLRPGDEVILSSHTMLATASAIVTAGGKPVPVDIGDDGLMCPDSAEAAINRRTVGIMPTHLNGRTCNMERIMNIVDKHNLFLVEDAAQALGSRFKGKHAGTFGSAAAISFFPAKVLGCLGDGGAVLSDDPSLFDRMWQLHDHGRNIEGEVMGWGRNSRLDNLQAAILLDRMKRYPSVIARRREVASIYNARLGELHEVKLPPAPNDNADHFDVFQNFEIEADRRDSLRDHLRNLGVGTLVQWGGKAVHQWERLGFNVKLPNTEAFFKRCLLLPMNAFVSDEDVHYVCDSILAFYRG